MAIAQPPPIQATIGETFDVRLEGIPTSGYTWELDPLGLPDMVEFIAAELVAPQGQVAGAAAVQVFRFRAARPGETHLRFRYRRRWEAEPLRETQVNVAIHPTPALGKGQQDQQALASKPYRHTSCYRHNPRCSADHPVLRRRHHLVSWGGIGARLGGSGVI
jgi:predicted secreted protein